MVKIILKNQQNLAKKLTQMRLKIRKIDQKSQKNVEKYVKIELK